VAVALAFLAMACAADGPPVPTEVSVHVGSVGLDPRSGTPVVVLAEDGGPRTLPIWIGFAEAASIAAELAQDRPPRPNTHDLLLQVIADLEGRVERVVVTELRGGTYFALLHVRARGRALALDARPSDAVAVALRADAPLFVREAVFEAARETPEGGDAPAREARGAARGVARPTRS
jgi:bifunctional DNase/RNase